jgi:selenide,water dikinase
LSATGVVHPKSLLTNQKAQPGDRLILTKPIGTGFVTTAFKMGRCPDDVLQAAVESMRRLNNVASECAVAMKAHAATDITGFGLAGHANEMADSSGVTITIEMEKVPLLPGTRELAEKGNKTRASASNRAFAEGRTRIDHSADGLLLECMFDAQTSGGLLISISESACDALLTELHSRGVPSASVIGEVRPRENVTLVLA